MGVDKVIVPLDFGKQADRALPVARALADRIDARLAVLVITGPGLDPAGDGQEARWHAGQAGCHIDDVLLRPDEDVVSGILAASTSPRAVLCLATNARGRATDVAFRSVSEEVLRRASAPVLTVGPVVVVDPWPSISHIVACVGDDPAVTDRVLDVTALWSDALGVDAHLVRVVPPAAPGRAGGALVEREALDAVVRSVWARGIPATSALVVGDDARDGILRTIGARPGTLAVLGSQVRSRRQRLVHGSVTLEVVRRSPMPVLVVPPGVPHELGGLPPRAVSSTARTW